jgi:hypothetical protein
MTMAAAGAIQHSHLPNHSIQWHSEARDVLHREMRIVLYHCIAIAIKTACNLRVFCIIIDSVVAHNRS